MLGWSLLRRARRSPIGERIAMSPGTRRSTGASRCGYRDSSGSTTGIWTRSSPNPQSTRLAGRCPGIRIPRLRTLRQLDFRTASVFEYGCGNSTFFWAGAAREVVSVEDNQAWFERVSKRVPSNCRLIYEPDLRAFVDVIRRVPGSVRRHHRRRSRSREHQAQVRARRDRASEQRRPDHPGQFGLDARIVAGPARRGTARGGHERLRPHLWTHADDVASSFIARSCCER